MRSIKVLAAVAVLGTVAACGTQTSSEQAASTGTPPASTTPTSSAPSPTSDTKTPPPWTPSNPSLPRAMNAPCPLGDVTLTDRKALSCEQAVKLYKTWQAAPATERPNWKSSDGYTCNQAFDLPTALGSCTSKDGLTVFVVERTMSVTPQR